MIRWPHFLFAAILLVFLAGSASAQGGFFQAVAWRFTPSGAVPAGGVTITICLSSGTGTPCTPTASVYSDAALTVPVTNPLPQCTASPQLGCLDNLGNFSGYATPGQYLYTVTGAGITAYGPIPITAQTAAGVASATSLLGPGSISGTFSGNHTLTGNLTATAGQNAIKAYNFNNILYVDGIKYTTLAAALAACPSTGCMILDAFPETFAADPFASITAPFEVHLIAGVSSAVWLTNLGLRIGHDGQTLYGAGPNFTILRANSGTFPSTTAVISVGAPGPGGTNGSGVFNLAVDCVSVTACTGIALDGAQELSGTMYTQVVNCMADCYQISSAQGAGAGQNQMILDHIRATGCSPSAPATCVPIHILSTAGFRVSIRDATAVAVSPATVTDCIKNDSTNATPFLETIHVEACTNGFHNTAAGGTFEVDNMFGFSSVPTMVLNDSSSAGYTIRQMTLDGSTNSLVDTGRSITTASPSCTAYGIATSFVSCVDRAVPYQFPSSLRVTPPIGAGPGFQEQLLVGFTPTSSAFLVLDNNGASQVDFKNDGRPCFRGNQTGAFVQCPTSDTLTASRFPLYPNGLSATVMPAALVTTAAATDNVTIQGMTASGHCSLTATNAAAAAAALPSVTTKAANQITVTHAVTANMNYDVLCTSN